MPSVTPERRRRDSSSEDEAPRKVHKSRSSDVKNDSSSKYQRNSQSSDRKSSRSTKPDEHSRHRHENTSQSRSRRNHRSRSRSKSRERHSESTSRSSRSSNRPRSSHHRDESSFHSSRVKVKEEPVSDDDERRRNRSRRTEGNDETQAGPSNAFDNKKIKEENKPKEKPNFQVSGKLAEDTNIFNGVVVKYNEPLEAKKPVKKWRLYAFKGEEALPMLPIHRQSAYLLGRDRKVADIPIDHPSCSKQHAVLQFRAMTYTRDDGSTGKRTRPYIIDLESSNGTFVNNLQIEARRYVELFEKDVIKFGFSSREYVLLHERSAEDDMEDEETNVDQEEPQAEATQETADEK